MKLFAHYSLQSRKCGISRAMAGVELRLGIVCFEPLSQRCKFLFALVVIKQMKTTYNAVDRVGACRQDILKTAMSTTCKEQTASI